MGEILDEPRFLRDVNEFRRVTEAGRHGINVKEVSLIEFHRTPQLGTRRRNNCLSDLVQTRRPLETEGPIR
jgi:hypothetical protein